MQSATQEYKQSMELIPRNQSYMVVTIGVINQVAQKDSAVAAEHGAEYSYLSNFTRLLDNYDVELEYATLEQDHWRADGSMVFPPRPEDVDYLYNNGVISKGLLGPICFTFGAAYDIRGLTINWGRNYPVDFSITNGIKTVEYTGNTLSYWTTDEIFDGTEYLLITPTKMVNGQGRLRIQKMLMGIGISFENKKIMKSTKTEYISPVTEELSTVDFSLQIENYNRMFDVENKASAIHYLEVGQEVTVRYGYDVRDDKTVWMDGCVTYLSDWEADDTMMSFNSKDKIDDLSDIYYRGLYRPEGITLYDLALDVLTDAGLDERAYELDEYLTKVTVYNPLPCVTHKECLQIIANAGRCKLYQDRKGIIRIQAAFVTVISPERMIVQSEDAAPWSNLPSVVNGVTKYEYATMSQDHWRADGTMYFLPRTGQYLAAGFASAEVADADGDFQHNPKFTIVLEAAMIYYSLRLNFSSNPAQGVIIHTYFEGALQESYVVPGPFGPENLIEHEFPQFDTIEFEFTQGQPNSRIFVDSVVFGDVTDYNMDYRVMTKTPVGRQKEKVSRVDVVRSIYGETDEVKNIFQETVDVTDYDIYTFYFSEASYDITATADGQPLAITGSSNYYASVDVSRLTGEHEFVVDGKAYVVTSKLYSKAINTTGTVEEWNNPLISEEDLAQLQADWLGNYFKNDIEYDIAYRGEPRLDAGDIVFLENRYVDGLQVQLYEHKLNFNGGALSGTIKARKAVGQEG